MSTTTASITSSTSTSTVLPVSSIPTSTLSSSSTTLHSIYLHLPDELLPSILSYIDTKELLTIHLLVNKTWYIAITQHGEDIWSCHTLTIPSSITLKYHIYDDMILEWMLAHIHSSLHSIVIHTQISLSFIVKLVEYYPSLHSFRLTAPHSTTFDIRENSIVDDDCFWLSQLSSLHSIDLDNCFNLTDQGVSYLSTLESLQSFTLRSPSQLTDKSLKYIGQLKSLHTLQLLLTSAGLDNSQWTCDGFQYLNALNEIKTLSVWNCLCTDNWLISIGKLTTLTSLDLDQCDNSTSDAYRHLISLQNLTHLSLSRTRIDDNALQWISCLSQLTSLRLCFCHRITDFGITHICKLQNMRNLNMLKCVSITDQGIKSICHGMKELQSLDASGCLLMTDQSLQYMRELKQLKHLHLSGCTEVTASAIHELKASMPHLVKLQHRTLASNTRRHLEAIKGSSSNGNAATVDPHAITHT